MKIIGVYKTQYDIESPEIVQGVDEPLGLEYILGVAKKEGHKVDLFLPKNLTDLEEILSADPDMILYSPTTNQINFNIELNRKIKNETNALSVIGGYHVSAQPSVIKKGFDFGVLGEGEETFRELLSAINNGKNYREIKGIAFLKNNELVINSTRERIKDLDSLADLFRTEKTFKQKSNYLAYPPTEERKTALIEYSRGCTFDCKFCASPKVLGRKIVYRKPQTVTEQLKKLKNFGINYVFFTDLNMTLNPKKVEDLTDALIKEDLNMYWSFMSGFRTVNKDLLKKLKESKCVKISWGIENILEKPWLKDETTKLPSSEGMKEILNYSADLGVINEGSMMIGWPNETEEDLERTIEKLPEYNLHMIRPSIYTPFPGTLDYEMVEKQGDIIEKDWSKYDTNNLVFNHPNFSNKQLRKYQKRIINNFYQSEEYRKRVENFTEKHPRYKKSFDEFLSILNYDSSHV